MKKFFASISAVLVLCACNRTISLEDLHWVDLSHGYDSTTLYWPNNKEGFRLQENARGINSNGYFYASNSISSPEHGGTHLDAPIHFSETGLTSDRIPLTNLIGKSVVIDVSEAAGKNRDYQVSPEDIQQWEKTNGLIPANAIVLFHTGYGKHYPDRLKYFGTALKGDEAIPELHFPGIHPSAAQWLVQNRIVNAVGLDTPSLDYGQSGDFKTHRILMEKNIPGFENLVNLETLPATGTFIVALPMKIANGTGGPLRIVAGLP